MNLVILIEPVLSFFNPFKVIPNCHLVLENKCKRGRTKKKAGMYKYFQEKQSTKKKGWVITRESLENCV